MLGDNSPALIPELCATLTATHLTSRQCGFAPPGKAAPAYTRGDYDPRQRPLPDREPSTNFKAPTAGTGVSARLSSHMGNLSMAFGVWRLVRAAAGGGRPRWCVSCFVVAIRRSYDVKCAEEVTIPDLL